MQAPGASTGKINATPPRAGIRRARDCAGAVCGCEDGGGRGQRLLCGVRDLALPLLSASRNLLFASCLLEF